MTGIEGGRLSPWEAAVEKIKTPFYLEPVMSVEIVFSYHPQVYSLATRCPSVIFPWFAVTYICCDVLLTPSFELAAFLHASKCHYESLKLKTIYHSYKAYKR